MLKSISRLSAKQPTSIPRTPHTIRTFASAKNSSTSTSTAAHEPSHDDKTIEHKATEAATKQTSTQHKTQAQLDQELQEKMAGIAGDGGDAGLELEDGKAVSMKRGVKSNMFRYI
ncbi:hypothetical protein LTR36_005420 [Oleoguttula mirabilis]|uniref:Uncharacterized protein n=1 Tax=Oleoguttula mirabilis TaxID=1507867 RepID=A0AAV9JE82_9PEZI|nr:hypothetical protein LTR36_005420 [Oleoguttula mirabilis]